MEIIIAEKMHTIRNTETQKNEYQIFKHSKQDRKEQLNHSKLTYQHIKKQLKVRTNN